VTLFVSEARCAGPSREVSASSARSAFRRGLLRVLRVLLCCGAMSSSSRGCESNQRSSVFALSRPPTHQRSAQAAW